MLSSDWYSIGSSPFWPQGIHRCRPSLDRQPGRRVPNFGPALRRVGPLSRLEPRQVCRIHRAIQEVGFKGGEVRKPPCWGFEQDDGTQSG